MVHYSVGVEKTGQVLRIFNSYSIGITLKLREFIDTVSFFFFFLDRRLALKKCRFRFDEDDDDGV